MTDEQLTSLRNIGSALRTLGSAMNESFNHGRHHGSKTPLQPLDLSLEKELPNLRREGQLDLANALMAMRSELGASNNG
jgi:hypothetical protein